MLASSLLCGFKQSASANLPRRICLIERRDLSVTTLQNIEQRDFDAHKIQVTEVAQCSAMSKICGINRASVLLNLPYFDIIKQVPYDIMHVVLEGVVPYTLKQILDKLWREKKINVEIYSSINNFSYASNLIKNKPSLIKPLAELSQSASQMYVALN